jgi:hypothetical protein
MPLVSICGSTLITPAPLATLRFIHRLAVRAKGFVRFRTPIQAAGELIIFLREALVIHLLASQMAAGELELGGILGGVHSAVRSFRQN